MEVKTLNLIINKIRRLYMTTFNSNFSGSGGMIQQDVTGKTPEEIYALVYKEEQSKILNQKKYERPGRDVVYHYCVYEIEQMTDDREKFGHTNRSSELITKTAIHPIYIGGEEMQFQDLLLQKDLGNLSEDDDKALDYFISSFRSNSNETERDVSKKIMAVKRVVKITGLGNRKSFFEKLEDEDTVRSLSVLLVEPE